MKIGELKKAIAGLDENLEIEIIARYEDDEGDEVEYSYDLQSITRRMDPDTAGEYARFECSNE